MKFILISVVCLLGAAVASPVLTKEKRDVSHLKGYGTDHHHDHVHDHHHHGSNEVEVQRALGGYVGSYNVPDNSLQQNNLNFQPLPTGYGPPNFTPGQPIGSQSAGPVQQTVHQHNELPAFPQQSTLSNFKPAENVETISNGYRDPVQAAQLVPTYQPVVHHEVQLNADQVEAQYLPPVAQKTIDESVKKPVDSYGIPIPDSLYAAPLETHQHQDVVEIKSQDASSSDVSSDVQVTPAVHVHHEVQTIQQAPIHQDASAHAHADAHAQTVVKAAQPQGQLNHVHHSVNHQVQKAAQPAVQQQNIFQQSAQQFPDFYAGLQSGNFGGSFDGFNGYQSYGVPSFGPSAAGQTYDSGFGNLGFGYQQDQYQGAFPTGNQYQGAFPTGNQYQGAFPTGNQYQGGFQNGNQYQGSFSTQGAVQKDTTVSKVPQVSAPAQTQQPQFPQVPFFNQNQQFPQITSFTQNQQFPQITGFGQNTQFPQVSSFTQQFPGFGQNQQVSGGFPSFIPNQFPQFPANQQGNNQVNLQPAQPAANVKSDAVNVKTVTQQVQPAGVQVNTHSDANSFVKPVTSFPANNGYVY